MADERRKVKVTVVGYYFIKEESLGGDAYKGCKTYEEAVASDQEAVDEGMCGPNELWDHNFEVTTKLELVEE